MNRRKLFTPGRIAIAVVCLLVLGAVGVLVSQLYQRPTKYCITAPCE